MTILVYGGRDFNDYQSLQTVLDSIHTVTPITKIVSGHARGADSLGEKWAYMNGVTPAIYPAQWNTHGKAAGPIRNQQMLDSEKIDQAVGCVGGAGTADMTRRLVKAGIPITKVGW